MRRQSGRLSGWPVSSALLLLGAALCAEATAPSHVEAGQGAQEVDERSPARNIDPNVLARMAEAAEDDDVGTVRQLLDSADMENFGFALETAARFESPQAAALLIERGAEVNNDSGWTPLHFALLAGTDRPALQVANLLLEHGADVHAATLVMGWTPLHLAAHLSGSWVWRNGRWNEPDGMARPDVLQVVQTLLERGADVNARTRIGGWTPVRVARESDGSADMLAALQAAGGRDDGCDDAPTVPEYWQGGLIRSSLRERERRGAGGDPECEYTMSFAVPGVIDAGYWWGGAGSFTAPGAEGVRRFSARAVRRPLAAVCADGARSRRTVRRGRTNATP